MKEKLDKANVQEILELTTVQKGMLFHFLNSPAENLYNVQLSFKIEGALDVYHLKAAIAHVVGQHEALRSIFRWQQVNKPLQIVLKEAIPNFSYQDLSDQSQSEAQHEIDRLTKEDHERRFDLEHIALRFSVYKISDSKYVFNITHHHILYDGWSTGIILEQLFDAYKQISGSNLPVVNGKPTYKNLHRELIRVNEQEVEYWRDYLREYELSTHFSPTGSIINNSIGKIAQSASLEKINAFATSKRVTAAALIYTAYGLLLQKINDKEDVVFGTTVADRPVNIKGNDLVVGNFINTIPLRIKTEIDQTLEDIVLAVNNQLLNRNEYSHSSYYNIKKALEIKATDELFDSVVIIENYPLDSARINSNEAFDLSLRSVYENTGIPLVITTFFNDDNVEIELAYQTSVITDRSASKLLSQLHLIIDQIINESNISARDLTLVDDVEKSRILQDFNDTALEYDRDLTLITLFETQAAITPQQVALVLEEEELTYAELNEKVNGLAVDLRSKGVKPNDVVALHTSRSLEMFISLLSVLKAGACYLPLDPKFPKERLEYMLMDSGAEILINTSDLKNETFDIGRPLEVMTIEHRSLRKEPANLPIVNKAEDLAYLIYTSGSTGKPKGVMIPHRSVHNYIVSMMEAVPFSPNRPIVSVTTFSFDIFVTESLLPLTQGIRIVIADEASQKDPKLLSRLISMNGVKMMQTTPSRYSLMTEDQDSFRSAMEKMECLLVGGEAFPPELLQDLKKETSANIINVYGPTETTVWSSLTDLTNADKITIGKPIGNTQLYALNKYKQLQPVGVSGELYIGGDGLAHGYWNNVELTDKVFVDNPYKAGDKIYKTGDRVRWTEEGELECLGRVDFQVKIRGHRIETQEIETHLMEVANLEGCAIIAREVMGSLQLVAYYLAANTVNEQQVKEELAAKVPDYMVPSYFMQMDKFPMTPNGKLDKKSLPEPEIKKSDDHVQVSGDIEQQVFDIWQEVLGHSQIGSTQNFFDVGGDSLKLITVSTRLNAAFNTDVTVTELFNYTTISAIARHLSNKTGISEQTVTAVKPTQSAIAAGAEIDIAIIGMAGRFPNASDLHEFWQRLRKGEECIERKDNFEGDNLIYAKGLMPDYECFDAAFFNYIPSEASRMDPQIRVFHECTWEALEDAGYNPYDYQGKIGLYGGASANPYFNINVGDEGEDDWVEKWEAITYADKDFLCPRVSYKLNLKGPSVNIATACSTSLVAVDTACTEILAGKCDMAVAGGVSISLHDNDGYTHHKGMILSDDGRCRAFDNSSTGTVSGNGVGMVVLKRLADAQRDGDIIHAVIKATATNNDGHEKIGFTAPSIEGQCHAIRTAISKAGIEAESISYIEAHGTGTTLGDPIEIAGLTAAFNTSEKQYCAVGSVKTNIGHLDAAAGIAGLIKTVLCLKNKQIAPSLHFREPNTNIDFGNTPFYINDKLVDWKNGKYPRRAGVSSFGIGGTNAHVILEEAPQSNDVKAESFGKELLTFSAKTRDSLQRNIRKLHDHLISSESADVTDIAYSLSLRENFQFRLSLTADNDNLIDRLGGVIVEEDLQPLNQNKRQPMVFMFSGQGSQYAGMCAGLYKSLPYFKEIVETCLDKVKASSGRDLSKIIFESNDDINSTINTQPALFIIEYALAKQLMQWNITPDHMIGHSVGEYVAACISGVFSLEDALKIVLKRGELMQQAPTGAMLSVSLNEHELLDIITEEDGVSVSAVNSSNLSMVSGKIEKIEKFSAKLEEVGISSKLIKTSHAFHSYMMDGIIDEFMAELSQIELHSPVLPFISNTSGELASAEQVTTAEYWASHLRNAVRFADGVETILIAGEAIFLEVGPGNVLSTLVRTNNSRNRNHKVFNTVKHPRQGGEDVDYLLGAVGGLWEAGVNLNWSEFFHTRNAKKVSLPTYAFERIKYSVALKGSKLLAEHSKRRNDPAEWVYEPVWKCRTASPVVDYAETYLVFIDNNGPGERIVEKMVAQGLSVVEVNKGETFRAVSQMRYCINPNSYNDYKQLFDNLSDVNCRHIIYNWTMAESFDREAYQEGVNLNFFNLTYITKAAQEAGALQNTHITLMTRNLENVLGEEKTDVEQAPLLGLIKVIAQEYSISTSHIDISWIEIDKRGVDKQLLDELARRENGLSVALRNGRRWQRTYDTVAVNLSEVPLSPNRTYLITGGLGSLGYTLARHLLSKYSANLILMGRSALSKEGDTKYERLKALRELGKAEYIQADITDLNTFKEAVATVEESNGIIHGVIHAAGSLTDDSINMMSNLSKGDFNQQFATKLTGTRNIHEVFASHALDFCIATSSISSILGGLKFGAYASANLAMDYHINMLRETNQMNNLMTVNFDGLAFDKANEQGLKSDEITKTFDHVLHLLHLPQVVISVGDLNARIETWVKNDVNATTAISEIEIDADNMDSEMLLLWKDYFGMDDIKMSDDFFELGGDSLKVLTIIGRINKKFGVELSITDFFERPTVRDLSGHMKSLHEQSKPSPYTVISACQKMDFYPLSSVQRRLYFLYEFDAQSTAYNMPLTLELLGEVDIDRLNKVFQSLISRHETFRTTFNSVNEEPCQCIVDQVNFEIEYYHSVVDVKQTVSSFIRPFDLSKAPLLRVGLIKISEEQHILMADMPHIITDGVSKGVLMKDFMALYASRELEDVPLHYKDYAVWQQSADTLSEIGKQKDFWLQEFSDEIIPLDLPTDHLRPAVKSFEGDLVNFEIDAKQTVGLRCIAEQHGTTLFTVLLAAYNVLLSKLSNQSDITVGTPISGRHRTDLEQMLGMFINTLPLRNHIDNSKSFSEFLTQVKAKALRSFDHQLYPYELLIDDLKVERNTSRNPLFDALFSFENFEKPTFEIPGLKVSPYDDGHVVSKFDLTLTALERNEVIAFNFEYCTKIFNRSTVEKFVRYFRNIIGRIVADSKTTLSGIEIISMQEKELILKGFNDTDVTYERDKSIPEMFESTVAQYGTTAALIFENEQLTYSELNGKSNDLALKIIDKIAQKEGVVGIMLPRSLDMLVSIMAVLKSGNTYVPIDPEYPVERIHYIAESSDLSLLLTDSQDISQSMSDIGVTIDTLAVNTANLSYSVDNLERNVSADQLAYMIFTSGSTGQPKGVMIEHRNVINFIKGVTDRIDMSDQQQILCLTTISFDIFVLETLLPLLSGKTVVIASTLDQKDPERLSQLITANEIEMMQITPSHLKLFMSGENYRAALSKINILMVGGEALPGELLKALRHQYSGKIFNMYGPTETTVWSAIQDLSNTDNVNIGKPIANTTIRIIDEAGKLQPVGIAGELCIGGAGVGRGYWRNEKLTAERFITDPVTGEGIIYKTGDMARWLPDGNIDCIGRIDNQVKVRGFRIELGEIESQLQTIEGVEEAVVYTKGDDGDKYLVAYYVSQDKLDISLLRKALSEKLPEYMVPSYFSYLEELPLTPNGKIDRKSLPDPEIEITIDYIAPSTEVEEKLVKAWAEILKSDSNNVSINKNFFELGGNSLKAAITVNKIFKELDVQVTLQEFFAFGTIEKIAEYIENELWIKNNTSKEVTLRDEFIID